jgi:hypothetical protein
MRTRTTVEKLYQFDELSDAAKESAREWLREANAGDNYFSESVIESAQTAGEMLGIAFDTARGRRSEPAIYWSGFWSQGDGACFAGTWNASQVKAGAVADEFTGDCKSNVELRRIAAEFERIAADYPGAYFRASHTGRYSHSGSVSFECEPGDDAPVSICSGFAIGDDDACDAAIRVWRDAFPEDDLIQAARDFMDWIYRSLESEYEYQNADAQVDDNIRANEYEFTEDGVLA